MYKIKNPYKKTLLVFVVYYIIFLFFRFILHTDDFLDNVVHEMAIGLIIGLLLSFLVIIREIKKLHKDL